MSSENGELCLDVPQPGVLEVLVHVDDDPVAEVAGPDVHVLARVVAADNGRGCIACHNSVALRKVFTFLHCLTFHIISMYPGGWR